MLTLLFLLLRSSASVLPALAADKTLGVSPSLLAKYTPIGSGASAKWKCLDGSKEIAWDSVNDDYCDCDDGSDEPGTSACLNTTFWCVNKGHIGAKIRSSRVNDGLCEPECCDGSDEQPSVCPNICFEVGKEYRKHMEAEMKTRKTGSKIRSTYISFAKKEQKRLESLVATTATELVAKEKEVARLKDILDRLETTSAEALEFKKQSPLYHSLELHNSALRSLKESYDTLKEKERTLAQILESLRTGYNPNYQDMAVLEAVRGYEEYAHLPHINSAAAEEAEPAKDEANASGDENEAVPEVEEEDEVEKEKKLQNLISSIVRDDLETLLMEHDNHIGATDVTSVLFDIGSYLPDALLPQYEMFKSTFGAWLELLGLGKAKKDSTAETTRARTTFQDAERALTRLQKDKQKAQDDLARLFDPEYFGAEGEWKKLDGQCLSTDTGEYTYEVCLFGQAKQIPNKGGSTFTLGKFSAWNDAPEIEVGSPAYYSKMKYTGGQRCWNGPERSVTVVWTCGAENALHTVSEPEKCEYQFTGTTPALCLPIDEPETKRKEDL